MSLPNTMIPSSDELNAMSEREFKRYEARLRREADRQGLYLLRSRSRDVRDMAYGTYMLVDVHTGGVVTRGLSSGYGVGLDAVAGRLAEEG